MKNLIYAMLALFGVLVAVVTSSLLLSSSLRDLESKIGAYTFDKEPDYALVVKEFSNLRDEFDTKSYALSLLVSDNALVEVEQSFGDIIGYARAESYDGVLTSLLRLQTELEHLRELAGFNVKSVF